MSKQDSPWGIDALDYEAELQQGDLAAQQEEINKLYAKTFSTDAGRRVLKHLVSITLDQPCWIPSKGNEGTQHGFVREGQNSVVRDIINRIKQTK